MVRIRLTRTGRRNAPAYRIAVMDQKAKRDGRSIEIIGNYNPGEDPKAINYKKDRYEYWLSVGAQPSTAVKKLIAGSYKYVKYAPKAEMAAPATAETAKIAEGDNTEQSEQPAEEKA